MEAENITGICNSYFVISSYVFAFFYDSRQVANRLIGCVQLNSPRMLHIVGKLQTDPVENARTQYVTR